MSTRLCSLVQHGWLHHLPLCNSILKFLLILSILNYCPCSSVQGSQSFSIYVSADVSKNVRDEYRHHSYPCVSQWSKHPKNAAKLKTRILWLLQMKWQLPLQLFNFSPCLVKWCCAVLMLKLPISLQFNGHFFRWTWVSQYQNVSILDFIGAQDDGGGDDNCSYKMCKAPVKSSPSINQHFEHSAFYRLDALPVAQPTVLKQVLINW